MVFIPNTKRIAGLMHIKIQNIYQNHKRIPAIHIQITSEFQQIKDDLHIEITRIY